MSKLTPTGSPTVERPFLVHARVLGPLLLVVALPFVLLNAVGNSELVSATNSAGIMLILVIGLYTFCGNSGVLAFGHVAFVAVGAYVCGLLTIPLEVKPALMPNLPKVIAESSVPPMAGVALGGIVAAAVAAAVFLPLRRLSAVALSIATLALLLMAHAGLTNMRLGTSGGAVARVPVIAGVTNILPWLLGTLVVAYLFQTSRFGLRLRASREDEFAAESAGIDVGWSRYAVFVLSAGMMGVGGAMFALSLGSFSADDFFLDRTILLFAMMVVGGMRSLTGAVAGTALISAVIFLVGKAEDGLLIGNSILTLPTGMVNVVVSLIMVVILIVRRDGILGDREIRMPSRRSGGAPKATAGSASTDGELVSTTRDG